MYKIENRIKFIIKNESKALGIELPEVSEDIKRFFDKVWQNTKMTDRLAERSILEYKGLL